jgi:MFS family permease
MTASVTPHSRAAFRHRAFRYYWIAQLVSFMGTFMQQVALGYLVYDLTGSKWLLGATAALQMGPSLLLSLPAGVLADRVQRRHLIMMTQSSALLLAFSLATLIALHRLQVWEILLISTLSGIAIAVESPTRQAFVVDLVGKDDLANAIAWNSLVLNGARVLGPALGGVVIRFGGVPPIFYFNSISFLAVIVALLAMRLPDNRRSTTRHPWEELREGLGYLRRSPALILLLSLMGTIALFAMNFNVLMPIVARDVLHTGAVGLGWMWSALGVGAVVGSITVVRWSRIAVAGPLLLIAAFVTGAGEIMLATVHVLSFALVALVAVGWSTGTFFAGINSAIQARIQDVFRGRVLSVYAMIFSGTGPVGGIFAAGLAGVGGASLSLAVAGAISVATPLAAWPLVHRYLQPTLVPSSPAVSEAAS